MVDIELNDQLRRGLVSAWHEFLEAIDPIRPDLYRYCERHRNDRHARLGERDGASGLRT